MIGRPSNRDERYEQIMQALVRCVARYGLDGASLSQIAKEAGLTRPLIRHHLGNRDELITTLQDYVLKSFSEQSDALVAGLPASRKSRHLIDLLFSDMNQTSPDMVLAFAALTARAVEDASLRLACREALLAFETTIAAILRADFPNVDAAKVNTAAHGIVALYFNATSLAPLDMPNVWKTQAEQAARALFNGLEQEP
ncbi:TetR/AcrR family transcriptional regulator [Ruegeria sp. THAF33]|uniref:TetR/AcrR family transcriptional regulator n=1 Tax=Ruegeria sp. THAF33 TaxID=2587853 RepID=UPI0012679F6C|nr:TetR/AcrR family transcriptional regulator [Ruegeria sp. THAF33]QFT75339.1 transcriptional regulator BetI [Ruegeria sp. THAF33]